ncbi:aspartate dehydrogenase [Falsihalocynthiibacter sp. SS001]|uniref:aspartate dehydrogenase n=1 Tax=Falsihalocynthiibacter sp. SS001 TaxID=3349698 RepID=UPI0036D2D886
MNITLIGFGAIAQYVMEQLENTPHRVSHVIVPSDSLKRYEANHMGAAKFVTQLSDVTEDIDLFIDCAGHGGLRDHGLEILRAGHDLLTVSIGALADAALSEKLDTAAKEGNGTLHLVSGAIGGLDALRAARIGALETVRYVGRKPPKGWIGSPAEGVLDLANLSTPTPHFSGSAREAAQQYPKNANVAAAVALSGVGFGATQVELIADPNISQNIHEITANGDFGQFTFTIEGNPLQANPRTSALAAMSVIASIHQHAARMKF